MDSGEAAEGHQVDGGLDVLGDGGGALVVAGLVAVEPPHVLRLRRAQVAPLVRQPPPPPRRRLRRSSSHLYHPQEPPPPSAPAMDATATRAGGEDEEEERSFGLPLLWWCVDDEVIDDDDDDDDLSMAVRPRAQGVVVVVIRSGEFFGYSPVRFLKL